MNTMSLSIKDLYAYALAEGEDFFNRANEIATYWRCCCPGRLVPSDVVFGRGGVFFPACAACSEILQAVDVAAHAKSEVSEPECHFEGCADVNEVRSRAVMLQDRLHRGTGWIDLLPEALVRLGRE